MNEKTNEQMHELTLGSIKKQQTGLKILTGAAIGLWLVAMAASIFILWSYAIFYLPKEKEMVLNFEKEFNSASTNTVSSDVSEKAYVQEKRVLFSMTRALAYGVVATAASVAVLSGGMFATIILVIWNRRVTLRQINVNLTQISAQLKELQIAKPER